MSSDIYAVTSRVKNYYEDFVKLEKLGILSIDTNYDYPTKSASPIRTQPSLDFFMNYAKGHVFEIQTNDSNQYPYQLVFNVNGVEYFVLMTKEKFLQTFWPEPESEG